MILGGSANNLVERATGERVAGPQGVESTKAQVQVWSTDAARAHERFSYWREALCRTVFNISIDAAPERFAARIAARGCGPLRFAVSECTGYKIVRTRRDIESAPADHYSVYMPLRGQTVLIQGDDTFEFMPHDIAISDGTEPFHGVLANGARAIAVIPRVMIDRRAPWVRQRPLRKLAANARYVDLAARHLHELTASDGTLTESATNLLTENLCNLLALASAPDVAADRLEPELQIEALLAFCRQNLHDAELSPQRVADHFGISLRTLHLRFKQIGQTFGRWVLDNRLAACRAALRDQNQRGLNISEIAYRWGFNDLSHFNKAFRAQFNQTPRDWRHGAGS
jgi:AraC family transcriptional regulator, positive regulator of tynA and feaB